LVVKLGSVNGRRDGGREVVAVELLLLLLE
jgi:hypothetical protein